MGQQPLVARPEPFVLGGFIGNSGLVRIGSLGQRHQHPESLACIAMAGGVVQGGGIDLHQSPCRDLERLDLSSMQNTAFNMEFIRWLHHLLHLLLMEQLVLVYLRMKSKKSSQFAKLTPVQ